MPGVLGADGFDFGGGLGVAEKPGDVAALMEMSIDGATVEAIDETAMEAGVVAFLEPGERYGAGRFARECRRWIREIESRGRVPILAGGTGFFVSALTRPVFREPDLDRDRRGSSKASRPD